jgi:hypothetical protein
MKKLFIPLAMAAAVAMTGCSEDFEVTAPYKDVTVVYGILDPLDTAHYIRIQKAFLDENKSAIDMSKVSDSSYYQKLTVILKEYADDKGKTVSKFITLKQVDMAAEGYPKDAPLNEQGFFQSPHKAYKFTNSDLILEPYKSYRLVINNDITGNVDSSELISIVNPDSSKAQNRFYISSFTKSGYTIDFAKTTLNNPTYTLLGNVPLNGRFLEGVIRFHYVDKNIATGSLTPKHVDYKFDRDDNITTQFKLEVQNKSIFAYLADAIGTAPTNVERYLDSCDLYVYAGDNYMYTYEQVNLAQSGGIAADQIKPYYTNIRGANTLGLLASRTFRFYENAGISQPTIDSLKENAVTRGLNIKGRTTD